MMMDTNTVYLNGEFMPMTQAKISPLDRGFLFGDGIYEVVPSHNGKLIGFSLHMERMQKGLDSIGIKLSKSVDEWRDIFETLIQKNAAESVAVYLHVSRGADVKRFHAYPDNVSPTIFAFAFEIAPATVADRKFVKTFKVTSTEDLRWKRCQIKSTSLLGNVMHLQQGIDAGVNEILLYNSANELTEAAACNVFIVKDGKVFTPPLDNQILAGVTRNMVLDILRTHSDLEVQERVISMEEVRQADEVWLTSSSKEIAPVVELDGEHIGDGQVGAVWEFSQKLYSANKFSY
ncbi:aminotransferase class IV [Paraglaciecola sp. 2405UD69-4]|uniref:aminotransferase class IV n=1 Tax=Paraglaciecola sp. 2405UD69-4 TaxID=3391836 RepID=UPI0039C94F98